MGSYRGHQSLFDRVSLTLIIAGDQPVVSSRPAERLVPQPAMPGRQNASLPLPQPVMPGRQNAFPPPTRDAGPAERLPPPPPSLTRGAGMTVGERQVPQ